MTNITRFPPNLHCPTCGDKLRPATSAEIRRGFQSNEAAIRRAYAHAVQGDMGKKLIDSARMATWMEGETPPGSWVLLCDSCGLTQVHMQEGNV